MKNVRCVGFDNLADTLDELKRTQDTVAFINGGTDFLSWKKPPALECIVDLSKVTDLQYISEEDGILRIGAGTTFAAIAASGLVRAKATALAQAAGQVGSVQIRNRATLGGNIASASPANDSLPVLAAFGAAVVTVGPRGSRTMTVAQALAGPGRPSLQDKELIKEIVLPLSGNRSAFGKLGGRTTVTIARLNLAILVDYREEDNTIVAGKVALGAVGPAPVCPAGVERFLTNRRVDSGFAGSLAELLSEAVNAAIPARESRPYKAAAIKGLAFDLADDLFGDRLSTAGSDKDVG